MIFLQLTEQLNKLSALLRQIDEEVYCSPIDVLSGASIGQHSRHIAELMNCMLNGYESGTIDYTNRLRNLELEKNKVKLLELIGLILSDINKPDKSILLKTGEEDDLTVASCYYREVVYNTEHTIHHLALIKVALQALNLKVTDENFGLAYSTIQFKAAQAVR